MSQRLATTQNKYRRPSGRRLLKQAMKQEHGFVRRTTRHDPPSYKDRVVVNYKRRIVNNDGATESTVNIDLSTLLLGSPLRFKPTLVQAWGTVIEDTTQGVYGSVAVAFLGDTTSGFRASDQGAPNHFPAVSIVPPQDDWYTPSTGVSVEITARRWIMDVTFQVQYDVSPLIYVPATNLIVSTPSDLPITYAVRAMESLSLPPSEDVGARQELLKTQE